MNWVHFSLVALLGYAAVNTGLKYVSRGDPFVASFFIYVSAALAMLAIILTTNRGLEFGSTAWIAAGLGIFSVVGTLGAIVGVAKAPNPGYVSGIFSTNVVLVTLLSVPLFGSRISAENFAGTLLAVTGIFLVTRA